MALPICPKDCTTTLSKVKFNECAPEIVTSEIRRIFISLPTAKAFTNVAQASEWTTRTSETEENADTIRVFTVIGDKPAATSQVKEISGGRKHSAGKEHVVNFTIDELSAENYEFMRAAECGGRYKIWYETAGGFLYGGNEGINADVTMDNVLNRGKDEIETIVGSATWNAKHHPERVLSPIFKGNILPQEG